MTLLPGQVAAFCRVTAHTVKKWCRKDGLKHWFIPGTNHHRIESGDLIAFLRKHENPVPLALLRADGQDVGTIIQEKVDGTN